MILYLNKLSRLIYAIGQFSSTDDTTDEHHQIVHDTDIPVIDDIRGLTNNQIARMVTLQPIFNLKLILVL